MQINPILLIGEGVRSRKSGENEYYRDGDPLLLQISWRYLREVQSLSSPLLHIRTFLLARISHLLFLQGRAWTVSELCISTLHTMAREINILKVCTRQLDWSLKCYKKWEPSHGMIKISLEKMSLLCHWPPAPPTFQCGWEWARAGTRIVLGGALFYMCNPMQPNSLYTLIGSLRTFFVVLQFCPEEEQSKL